MSDPGTGVGPFDRLRALDDKLRAPARAPLRDLWPYLRPHWRILLLVLAVSLVGAALFLAQPAVVSMIITSVTENRPLSGVVLLLGGLLLGGALLSGVQQYLLQRTAEAVVLDSRRTLTARLLRLPIREYDTRRVGDLVSRVGSDTTLLRTVVTSGLVDAVGGVVIFVGSVVAMALLDPLLLGVTLVVVVRRGRGGDRLRRADSVADAGGTNPGRSPGRRCRPGHSGHSDHPGRRRYRSGDPLAGRAGHERVRDRSPAGQGHGADRTDHGHRVPGRLHRSPRHRRLPGGQRRHDGGQSGGLPAVPVHDDHAPRRDLQRLYRRPERPRGGPADPRDHGIGRGGRRRLGTVVGADAGSDSDDWLPTRCSPSTGSASATPRRRSCRR